MKLATEDTVGTEEKVMTKKRLIVLLRELCVLRGSIVFFLRPLVPWWFASPFFFFQDEEHS